MNTSWLEKGKKVFNVCKEYILVAIILALTILVLFVWKRPVKTVVVQKDNLDLVRQVKEYKDLNNMYWATIKNDIIAKEEARVRNDSMAHLLRVKPKFIKGQDIYIVGSDTMFTELPVIVYKDKDTTYSVEKKDDYIDVAASVSSKGGSIQVKARDTLTRVEVIKNPLIGRTRRTIYLHNASPYNSITHGMSFTVKEKQPFLTVGPYVGYDVISKKPSVGLSLQYPIIKFKR